MMGKDAPGVGSYQCGDQKKSLSYGIPMAPRFENVTRYD
jgi:hypothetical protein